MSSNEKTLPSILESFVIAFSMYSRIPMPFVEWSERGMKYAFCFFPLIGVVIGACVCAFCWLSAQAGLGILAFSLLGTAVPLLITGGIHMDGFLDVTDARSSFQSRERKLEILKELTRLRQLCCGPSLFLEHYHSENAKLDTCMELVKQAIENGHKILLFSQFTSVLDELQKAFKHEQIKSHRIDGGVSKEERIRLTESFATDDTPVFCISLKAGGTGLNLTAADIVIHYDPWWNVAAQNQATDRTHRIGQKNIVTVYELIAEATIEEQILNLQKAKSDLVEEILSGDGIKSTVLNRDELLQML